FIHHRSMHGCEANFEPYLRKIRRHAPRANASPCKFMNPVGLRTANHSFAGLLPMRNLRSASWTNVILITATRIAIMLAPAGILGLAALRAGDQSRALLALGAAFQLVVCLFSFVSSRSWQQPVAPSVITLYLIALGWFWISGGLVDDWFHHLAQAVL